MSVRLLVPLLLVALALGLLVGLNAERVLDRSGSRTPRPKALEEAWRALESGERDALAARVATLSPDSLPTEAFREEARLLRAIAEGDRTAVEALADAGAGRALGAQALAWLIDSSSDSAERARLQKKLTDRYPESWRANRGEGGG